MRSAGRSVCMTIVLIVALAGTVSTQSGKPSVVPKAAAGQDSTTQAKAPARRASAARQAELAQRAEEFEEMLIVLEKRAWEEEKNQNADFFRTVMTGQFVAAEPDGKRYTKEEVLRLIPTARMTSYDLSDFHLIRGGRDAAVLTYRATFTGPVEGKETTTKMLATTVWVRRGTEWKMTFHQKTLAP